MSHYMKIALVAILSAALLLSLVPNYNSFADKPDSVGKPVSVIIEDIKEPKKIQLPDGRILEKRVHVFPNENAAKPDGNGGGPPEGKGKGGGDKGSTCYAEMAKGAKWKSGLGESYVVDDSFSGLASGVALAGIQSSVSVWESEITSGTNVFGSGSEGTVDVVGIGEYVNNVNEVAFADLGDGGTIAVTISWGIWGGPPQGREIVEWDQIYNTNLDLKDASGNVIKSISWGNAGSTDENNLGDTSTMDFENIAVHELGHSAGLDHSGTDCTAESMYAYATAGETKKRTLEAGDVAGINSLY